MQGSNFLEVCELQFPNYVITKNKQECETVAFFEASGQQKRAGTRVLHFLKLLDIKNEPDHESGALFEAFN